MGVRVFGFAKLFISALALFSVSTLAEDSIDEALAKVPTQQQMDEYQKISHKFNEELEKINVEEDSLSRKIDTSMGLPGVQFTHSHIDAAVQIHKKTREMFRNYLDDVAVWAKKSNRSPCVHQSEKTRTYMIKVSDDWLVRVRTLSLATDGDRIVASSIVLAGGMNTFRPMNSDPIRSGMGREMENLNAVCMGGMSEYEPGQEVK